MLKNSKAVFIGSTIMLKKCVEIAIKNFNTVYLISDDKKIPKKIKNRVKIIKLNKLKKIQFDYLFSVLNLKIIPEQIIKKARKLSLNFHDAPLPKYAGLFSSSWAIINGEKKHGVCWHKITKEIDTGQIAEEKKFLIKKNDTAYNVDIKGILIGINLFKILIKKLKINKLKFKDQNLKKRIYYGKSDIKKLLKDYKKIKSNINFSRAVAVSSEKLKNIFGKFYFKHNIPQKKILRYDNEKISNLIRIINKIMKTNIINKSNSAKMLENIGLNNHPKWDSLSHVILISALEKKFKIKINEENFEHFSNLKLIYSYLDKKKKLF